MASEQFSLCWDNFHSNMSNGLSSLLRSEDLVDVTLAAEGRQLKAHKMVLSVCSPYFRELFQSSPCKHPIVFLKDVSFSALSNLMEFMYQGEVKVSQDELGTFIKTAEQLKIKGLTGDSQNHTDTDSEVAALNANTSSRERDSPLPVSRKMAREKSPPARKKMLGPASKRFKSSEIELSPIPSTQPIKTRQSEPRQTESTTRQQQQQHESSSSRLTADRDQSHSDTDFETKEVTIDQQQLMQFKMEPDDANASVPIDDDLQYDDSTMDDMTMDSTTDYMMDPSDVSLTGKEMKPGTSSAMDNPEQAGENQETIETNILFDYIEKSEEEHPHAKEMKHWEKRQTFFNRFYAEDAVKNEKIWSSRSSSTDSFGFKIVRYRCNKVKYRGEACAAAIKLVYNPKSSKVILYQSYARHNHDEILSKYENKRPFSEN